MEYEQPNEQDQQYDMMMQEGQNEQNVLLVDENNQVLLAFAIECLVKLYSCMGVID